MLSRPIRTGTLDSSGAVRTCSSTSWKPPSSSWKTPGAERDHERQADGGVHGVAPADPVPESERVRRIDSEGGDLVERCGDGDEVVRDRIGSGPFGSVDRIRGFEFGPQPFAGEPCIGQRLESRECLGGDDEQGRLGIQILSGLGDVGGVDVRHEQRLDAGIRVGLESLVDHHRAQIRAADADVHDVRDLLARHSPPLAGAHPLGEGRHRVEDLLDVVIDILAVYDEPGRGARGPAQRGVQNGTVLGGVDVRTGEHLGEALG